MTPLFASLLLPHPLGLGQATAALTIPFSSPKGLIVIETKGNDEKPLVVMLDTGAQRTVIHRASATDLKLEEGEAVQARGAGGAVEARFMKGLHLAALGEAPLEAVAIPLDTIRLAIGAKIDVILGQDVLSKRVIEIDREKSQVTFGTRPPIVSASASVVSFNLRAGRPYLPAMVVAPAGTSAMAELLLDTGSDTVAELAEPYARTIGLNLKPDPYGRRILGVGGSVALQVAELREVRIGREMVGVEDVRVFPRPEGAAGDGDGRVGNGFLSRFKVIIDGPGKKLVLVPLKK